MSKPVEDAFQNQMQAEAYVARVADRTERLLLEGALNVGMGFLVRDARYLGDARTGHQLDLLTFVQALHAFFKERGIFQRCLSGHYDTLEEILFGPS